MKTSMWGAATLALLMAFASPTFAQRRGHPPLGQRGGFMLQTDADFGGDVIATVDFENDTSQDIRAGQGFALSVGGWFRPIESSAFEIQASIGYKYEMALASNADIHFSRTIMQLEALYRWPSGFYVGGGLMRHSDAKLSGDGFVDDFKFDDATGFNGEIGWRWIALHYSDIHYEEHFSGATINGGSVGGDKINGSSVGIRFTWRPGERWF